MKISVAQDPVGFYLTVTAYNSTEPAGPRLFKGGDIPDIAFRHTDQGAAVVDARKLQDYIDTLEKKRGKKKSQAKSAFDE